jgi:hypothetical protein
MTAGMIATWPSAEGSASATSTRQAHRQAVPRVTDEAVATVERLLAGVVD